MNTYEHNVQKMDVIVGCFLLNNNAKNVISVIHLIFTSRIRYRLYGITITITYSHYIIVYNLPLMS